jgi:hypothetical protein
MKFEELSDSALVALTYEQCKTERELLVDNRWALAALDQRKAVVALGFSSLFAFCREYLGLSKAETWRRTTAARLLVRFPILAEYLADKRLSLGSVCGCDVEAAAGAEGSVPEAADLRRGPVRNHMWNLARFGRRSGRPGRSSRSTPSSTSCASR